MEMSEIAKLMSRTQYIDPIHCFLHIFFFRTYVVINGKFAFAAAVATINPL